MPMPSPNAPAKPRGRCIVVGLDGSLRAYGWAILDATERPPVVLAEGCIVTAPTGSDDYLAERHGGDLDVVTLGVLAALEQARALSNDVTAFIEAPTGTKDPASAYALWGAFGLSRAVCVAQRVPRTTVQQRAMKVEIARDPDAEKPAIATAVQARIGWTSKLATQKEREAATDAVGNALTGLAHHQRGEMREIAPGPPRKQGRPPTRRKDAGRAPRGLSTDGLGPGVPSPQLFADGVSGGEGETRGI